MVFEGCSASPHRTLFAKRADSRLVAFQRTVLLLALLCSMPVLILKHHLKLEGLSHVVSLLSFSDKKAFIFRYLKYVIQDI